MIQTADVNKLLRVMGFRVVNSIDASEDADEAVAQLEEVHEELMARGWWFNTDVDYLLSMDNNSEIQLPSTTINVTFRGTNRFMVRDGKIYDRKDHTFTMTEDVLAASIVVSMTPDVCPQIYRRYWLAESKLRFCTYNHGETEKIRQLQTDLATSAVACKQRDLDMRKTSALQSQYAVKLTAGMPPSSVNHAFAEMYIGDAYDSI